MSVETVPAGPFVAWFADYVRRHGRQGARERLALGGEAYDDLAALDPDDEMPVKRVDVLLTRADDTETLATLYPETGPTVRRRGGGKPVGKYRRMTDDQVRAAHVIYEQQGLSLRALGALIYERFGYSSPKACGVALGTAFMSLGLPRRDRVEATIAAHLVHGNARRSMKASGDPAYLAHRRAQRRASGEVLDRPLCAGVRQQYPRKGEPCQVRAQADSPFCAAHDPDRTAERDANLADARAKLGIGTAVAA